MQQNSNCLQCKQAFDAQVRKPLKLDCEEVLCQSCAFSSYDQQGFILCPKNCGTKTQKKPYELTLVIELLIPKLKLKECELHEGMKKMLFCKDDLKSICPVCAQYTQIHKNHQIVDIQEQIQSLKQNEVKKANKDLQNIQIYLEECMKSLLEQKQLNFDQGEATVEKINKEMDILKNEVELFRQKAINELLFKQQQHQK